jgi:hypothetical protein
VKRLSRLALAAAVLATAGTAAAVDLKNEDAKKYDVKVEEGASTTSTSIEGSTTKVSICSECRIVVEGVGSVEASGSDVVVIKDGKLSKQ